MLGDPISGRPSYPEWSDHRKSRPRAELLTHRPGAPTLGSLFAAFDPMFFSPGRQHFFKPLTSKYREQVVQCLCLLYQDRKSTRLNSSHVKISYAVFCLKKKSINREQP